MGTILTWPRLNAGYAKTCTLSFGPVDWRHDPRIFGLEPATALSMEHALESYLGGHASLADVLLGERWDVRPVAAGNAFRVVLTMRVAVDEMQVDVLYKTCSLLAKLPQTRLYLVLHHCRTSPASSTPKCATESWIRNGKP